MRRIIFRKCIEINIKFWTLIIFALAILQTTVSAQTSDNSENLTPQVIIEATGNSRDVGNNEQDQILSRKLQNTGSTSGTNANIGIELQTKFIALERELLDSRANYIDRWLNTVAIVLTFFAIVVAILGILGFNRFRAIQTDAESKVKQVEEYLKEARQLVNEIRKEKAIATKELWPTVNAESADDNPTEVKESVETVQDDPDASIIDKAISKALSLQQQQEPDEAVKIWNSIAQIAKDSDSNLASRALFSIGYLSKGDASKQLDCYNLAINADPNFFGAYVNRGNAKMELKRFDEAIEDYSQAIRLDPDEARTYFNRGNAKMELKRFDEAIEDYSQAIRLDPDNARIYVNRGNTKMELRRFDEAIEDYNQAIRLNPDDAVAYFNRGNAKMELKRFDEAIEDYSQAIRLDPDNARIYVNRGNTKMELRRFDEAIEDYNQAIRLDPDDAVAYFNRGNAKMEFRRFDEAIEDYSQAIRLDPDNARIYVNRGNTKMELRRFDEAIEDYNQAIRLNPDDAVAYFNRGNAKMELKRIDEAIEDYSQAIRLDPDEARTYFYQGNAKMELKRFDEAIEDYSQAIRLNPDEPGAYVNRGNASEKNGQIDRALIDIESAINILRNKEHEEHDNLLKFLEGKYEELSSALNE